MEGHGFPFGRVVDDHPVPGQLGLKLAQERVVQVFAGEVAARCGAHEVTLRPLVPLAGVSAGDNPGASPLAWALRR